MIKNDKELLLAQANVQNLQTILVQARKVHSKTEYGTLSQPILLEIQRRQQDILDYLNQAVEATTSSPS